MSRAVAVLRPEPGNAATAARIEAAGLTAIRMPLFAVRAVDWALPDPARFDALILTSANAPRFAGPGLDALANLPVFAVGPATAAAARARGLTIAETGDGDGAELVATLTERGFTRALLLGGRERRVHAGGVVAETITVYASDPLPITPQVADALAGTVALLHSARAAQRLAEIAGSTRASIRLAAISDPVAAAAGPGWADIAAAPVPDDAALIALARRLAD
ncbi:uroporphyrinogen-III synthase [Sphingomonas panacisoli]|uniref:Uroporphyrinogen-III synthase n=1 Tax=Sphingomonas panacisoli TaxID=1813879 RepID=A0A5B8LP61_9SPHN|nr:uroporphyrinogen-III synthase [Sphingomonas panacisoli]QDZ08900.1 uroporphyrinogen-III synthase [Sphingomonas panacisoli]